MVVLVFLLVHVCSGDFGAVGQWFEMVAIHPAMVTAVPAAMACDIRVPLWLLAIGGTLMPLALRPTATSGFPLLGTTVQIIGTAGIIAALLSLRRSFGIVPAHRGIRTRGLYRMVRHPLYAAELFTILGIVLARPSPLNVGAFGCFCALQFLRAKAEERFLGSDPVYAAYRARVKYQLIPGVL